MPSPTPVPGLVVGYFARRQESRTIPTAPAAQCLPAAVCLPTRSILGPTPPTAGLEAPPVARYGNSGKTHGYDESDRKWFRAQNEMRRNMTTPGFTAEASLQNLRQGAPSLARLRGQGSGVQAAAVLPPGTTQAEICVLLPYFPGLEPLCCTWIRDPGISCMCRCKYSTGEFAPPMNVCVGTQDPNCIANCRCRCLGLPPSCTMRGTK